MLLPALLAASVLAAPVDTPRVSVRAAPERIFIEQGAAQYLNFDLVMRNEGADTLEISRIELSVYDAAGGLQIRKLVNENGPSPSARILAPDRVLAPGAEGMVFNPFVEFPADVELARLRYDVELRARRTDGERGEPVVRTVEVAPERYAPRTRLAMPLRGRVLVWDGHDFQSHHRRWNWTHPMLASNCITSNAGRYSYDFVLLGADDSLHTGGGAEHARWNGWEAEVRAPAAGRIVAATGEHPDDGSFDIGKLCADELAMYGNVVVIDHGNGEMSVLAHLRQGSVAVRVGDAVRQGEVVARVGSSGSSLFPHLHYQLVTGVGHGAEGLPSYFPGARVRRGTGWVDAPVARWIRATSSTGDEPGAPSVCGCAAGGVSCAAVRSRRTQPVFPGESVVEQAQKDEIERHLHGARKIMHDALQQCRTQKLNPAAVAQVLGENAVMLMIRNFGPDAGKHFTRSLSEEAVRMAHAQKTRDARPAD